MKHLKKLLHPLIFTLLGSGLGLVYYQNFACPTGTCPITSSAMSAGEIYTISVSAIPKDGNMKAARVNSVQFALPEVELPEPGRRK